MVYGRFTGSLVPWHVQKTMNFHILYFLTIKLTDIVPVLSLFEIWLKETKYILRTLVLLSKFHNLIFFSLTEENKIRCPEHDSL